MSDFKMLPLSPNSSLLCNINHYAVLLIELLPLLLTSQLENMHPLTQMRKYFTFSSSCLFLVASLFKTIWHITSASQIRSGEPAESTPRRLSVALPLYSIISVDDWWHTISKPSLGSCDGHWSMPSIVGRQAGGTPGSSIWSQGFSRTHTACGAAGLAGWTSVCDVQAGWTSRPSTQPASQTNVPCTVNVLQEYGS